MASRLRLRLVTSRGPVPSVLQAASLFAALFFCQPRILCVSYNASIWSNRSDHVTCGRNCSNEFVRLALLAVLSKLLPFYAVQTRRRD